MTAQAMTASTSNDAIPIVLVHGIRTSASMWRFQAEALRSDGYDVRTVDLPGHGARMGEPFTVDGAVEAIDDVIAAFDGPVLLVGLSLGGYYAIEYASRNPEKIAGLVAAGCSTVPHGPPLEVYRGLARGIRRLPDRGMWLHTAFVHRLLPPQGAIDVLAGGVALDVMDAGLRATGTLNPLAGLSAYDGPVWLVNGQLDHFRVDERRFLAACRDGRLVIVPGATHLASLVKPVPFTDAIRRAAAELSARRQASIAQRAN